MILNPMMAALPAVSGNSYLALFIVSGLFVIVGSFLVLPIKSVR